MKKRINESLNEDYKKQYHLSAYSDEELIDLIDSIDLAWNDMVDWGDWIWKHCLKGYWVTFEDDAEPGLHIYRPAAKGDEDYGDLLIESLNEEIDIYDSVYYPEKDIYLFVIPDKHNKKDPDKVELIDQKKKHYMWTEKGSPVWKKLKLQAKKAITEGLEQDYSDYPEVKLIDYKNNKSNLMPGIRNMKAFIQALNDTADKINSDKFKVRATRFPLSNADVKDEWMSLRRSGWNVSRAWDSSLDGFNEVYLCSKINTNESVNEGLSDIERDFENAKRIWDSFGFKYTDLPSAVDYYNRKSPNAEPSMFYAKPLYDNEAWDEMRELVAEWEENDDMSESVKESKGKGMIDVLGDIKENDQVKEAIDYTDDGWYICSYSPKRGYRLLRKIVDGKGKWRAQKVVKGEPEGEPFDITYEQALGREPIGEDEPIQKLSKKLGKTLLPKLGESYRIDDEDFQNKLKAELQGRLQYYYKKLGYTQREIDDYIMPVYQTELRKGYGEGGEDALFVWVGAEVDYDELMDIANVLNKVIQKYDKNAYFEPETSGRLISVLWE